MKDQTRSEAESVETAVPVRSKGIGRKVLFSAMKNEAPFLLEWIAYHKVIGFDQIVICSNASNDGMEEILAALAEAGEITHLKSIVNKGDSPQRVASAAFSDEIGYHDGDWYLWLDADEFLNVHVGDGTVDALIRYMGTKHCALINWRVFGASGQARFGGRFVDPVFNGASLPDFLPNLELKSLFRFSSGIRGFARYGINRPLIARGSDIGLEDVLVGNGRSASDAVKMHQRWLKGVDTGGTSRVPVEEFGWAVAQINHYIVRTPDLFALKRVRGRGYKPDAAGDANLRHTEAFFHEHDRNEMEDRTILKWQAAVTEEMARLLRLPDVAPAVAASEALVKRVMSQLEEPDLPTAPVPVEPAAAPEAASVRFKLTLPAAEAAILKAAYKRADVILEYGSGGSTVLAAELGRTVFSVESDKDWAERIAAHLQPISDKAVIHYANIGPTGEWGVPLKARKHRSFPSYALSVWDRPDFVEPDLVLVDGRFRASCLVAVMLRATRPVTILFDDYKDRRYYHGVERLARLEEIVGRMARFTVTPGAIPPEMVTQAIGWFSDLR